MVTYVGDVQYEHGISEAFDNTNQLGLIKFISRRLK